jgi:hypothetical protein
MYNNRHEQITKANGECKMFSKAYKHEEIIGEWFV